jgi:CheY-like chemotaxis protein
MLLRQSTMTPQGALRVLLVEDEFLVALSMERMLHRLGVEVVGPIGSVAEALAIACSVELDGAVLDVNVDGEKIYPCAEQLGERGIPFILTTGYAAANLPERYRTAARLGKPFSEVEFRSILERTFKPRAQQFGAP